MQADGGGPGKREPPPRTTAGWKRYLTDLVAQEVSNLTRHYDRVIQWLPRPEDDGSLMARILAKEKLTVGPQEALPDLTEEHEQRTAVLLNGVLNHHFDIQGLLMNLKGQLARTTRVVVVLYNPYLAWLYRLANRMGIRKGDLPGTFITRIDLENIAELSGFEVVRICPAGYCPWRILGIGAAINRLMPALPLFRWLGLTSVVVLRPLIASSKPGISCIIPARNERGNIESALKRFPDLDCTKEIIFVEGHSIDGTFEEIDRVASRYRHRFQIKILRQEGKGKADAVRLGLSHASQPLLVILDADLTMPPEMLCRFYRAYCDGLGDFVNGSRLVYPMQGGAMGFLNRLGNVFFAKALSWVLDCRIGDSLCGTKLFTRHDYERMRAWREGFGNFDPFGDFELLFPAVLLGLGVIDVPVRYLARTYGSTNIHRFRDGWQLLKMTAVGLWRVKMGVGRESGTRVRRPL